jgi:hypothetical protein
MAFIKSPRRAGISLWAKGETEMTPLYRITHLENLPGLLARGCDCSPNRAKTQGITKRAISHKDIMDKRECAPIRVPPGGVVADYVPFYFGPRSPMLYAIKEGKVAGYQGQKEIIYLVTSAETVATQNLPFMFTDGHGIISYVNHYNQLADLPKLFWNVINAKYWNDFVDGRCKRQAEFMVKDQFPLNLVQEIGVMDEEVRQQVQKIVAASSLRPLINVHREWYF